MSEQSNSGKDSYQQGREGPRDDDNGSAQSESDQDAAPFRTVVPQQIEGIYGQTRAHFVRGDWPVSDRNNTRNCCNPRSFRARSRHVSTGAPASDNPGPSQQNHPRDPVSRPDVQGETEQGDQLNIAAPAPAISRSNASSLNRPLVQPSNAAVNNPYTAEMLQHLQTQLMAASLIMQHQSMTSMSQAPSMLGAFDVFLDNSNQSQQQTILQSPMLLLLLHQVLTQMSNQSEILTIFQQLFNANPPSLARPTPNQYPTNMSPVLLALQAQLGLASQAPSGQGATTASNLSTQGGSSVASSQPSGLVAAAAASALGTETIAPSHTSRPRRRYQAEAK